LPDIDWRRRGKRFAWFHKTLESEAITMFETRRNSRRRRKRPQSPSYTQRRCLHAEQLETRNLLTATSYQADGWPTAGEGEIASSDAVRYRLALTDLTGAPLAENAVKAGQTFQLRGYVQDVRMKGSPDPGSTAAGNPTGVFAPYLDVLVTNADLVRVRYGETQELRMDATRPGGVLGTGSFRLTFAGQTTASVPYLASPVEDAAAIEAALRALPVIGAGNVQVTTLLGADFSGRYFIRFQGEWGEQDIPAMTVRATGLSGSYQDRNDVDNDGDTSKYLPFKPAPRIVDNFIPVNPTAPDEQEALLRSSFTFFDPYLNGPSVLDEPPEAGQPTDSRVFDEVGAFLNRFDLNSPPQYTSRSEYLLFSVDVRAVGGGYVQFSGNPADQAETLVFSLAGGGSADTEVPVANIGFIDPDPLHLLATPFVERLTTELSVITRPAALPLAARGVSGGDGEAVGVAFYRDTNGNSEWDEDDGLLGTDENGSDGWSWTASTAGWALGQQTLFARTRNNLGVRSEAASVRVTFASWQDIDNPFDVDADGNVQSLDVLMLINEINRGPNAVLPPRTTDNLHWPYFDVNGDGYLTPLDVLLVVQHINEIAVPPIVSVVSAEGESVASWGPGSRSLSRWNLRTTDCLRASRGGPSSMVEYRTPSQSTARPRRLFDYQDLRDAELPLLEWEESLQHRTPDLASLDACLAAMELS
jgi:hypothetical protein